jgi:hypothetical protein
MSNLVKTCTLVHRGIKEEPRCKIRSGTRAQEREFQSFSFKKPKQLRGEPMQLLGLTALLFCSTLVSAQLSSAAPATPASQQTAGAPGPQEKVQPELPVTTQLKKTIVFLESDCLHDFSKDAANLTRDRIAQMQNAEQVAILNQLTGFIARLRQVRASMSKLNAEETARLFGNGPVQNSNTDIVGEIDWKLHELLKMTSFTDPEIAAFKETDIDFIPLDKYRGTGFLIGYMDARLNAYKSRYFRYLVTNRHVIQPGIEKGNPCQVVNSLLLLNQTSDSTHTDDYTVIDRTHKVFKWVFPQDESTDLAVTPIGLAESQFDHIAIPTDDFVTADDIKNRHVVEGDPVLFSGLFVQTFDQNHTLEPIVRSGSVAMIPERTLPLTLNNKMGRVYLAEAHAFGGNSGSPMFVDANKFAGVPGATYKFLGVISGEVFENSDLTLTVTTTLSGNVAANSGVSIVVPAPELMKLLNDPTLQAGRDRHIAALAAKSMK